MTLANTTAAAAPTNRGNSEQAEIIYFGRASNSQTSQVFTVDQMPFYLSAFNLGSDDTITVQQVFGQGSGVEVGPFAPIHGAVQLTQQRTKVMVDYPGRYQLVHAGSSALGTFTVTGFAASMTSDPISDIAEALSASLGSFVETIFVEGTTPITVTGNGSSATPFDIGLSSSSGASPPDFVKIQTEAPILISGDGSNGNPYQIVPIGSYGVALGTNTYTATLTGLSVYFDGLTALIHFANANTGAATLNLNSLGAIDIQRRGIDVTSGQIPAGSVLQLVYDGVRFQIIGAA